MRLLEKKKIELEPKTRYAEQRLEYEGGFCSRRDYNERTLAWAECLLDEQTALQDEGHREETSTEWQLRKGLIAKLGAEIADNHVEATRDNYAQRVRDDKAHSALSDDISKQLKDLKRELELERVNTSSLVQSATQVLQDSEEALSAFEKVALCSQALSVDLAARVKRSREEAMLRREKKRHLNEARQKQAESDASGKLAISAGSASA